MQIMFFIMKLNQTNDLKIPFFNLPKYENILDDDHASEDAAWVGLPRGESTC